MKNDSSTLNNSSNEMSSQLDSEFDHHLANMKKHILLLQDKKGTI